MSPPRPNARVIAVIVATITVAGGLWVAARNGPAERASTTATPSGSGPSAVSRPYRLTLDLRRVQGKRVSGDRVRTKRLRPAAEAVRRVMTELYSTGFVDPDRWQGGRFPTIEDLFVLRTRPRARRDLAELTLGRLARRLDAVRPRTSTLGVRFLVGRRPLVAVALVKFRGTALAQGVALPVRSEGTYTLSRDDGRWRIASYRVRSRLPSIQEVDRRTRRAAGSPGLASTGPSFLLVIGSDARPGQSPEQTRADSIHIVGVNPTRGAVSILGIPRDSFVPIPGAGTNRINSALALGGPELMVRTIEQLTGVGIDGYVLTGFAGFRDLVNAVGGIRVRVPYPMSDPFSRAFFRPGLTRMTGRDALAFTRDRHDVPGGDYGRSLNQGRMLIAALRQLKADVARNPASLLNWIAAGARILRTDLGLSDMIRLLLSMPSLDPSRVENRVASGAGTIVGGMSVIRLGPAARATFRDFAADAIFNERA